MQFPRIQPKRKMGEEPFRSCNGTAGFTIRDFWQWSASDLVSNSTRGVLAEFLVVCALGLGTGVRDEWQAFDLQTASAKKMRSSPPRRCSREVRRSCQKSFSVPATLWPGTPKRVFLPLNPGDRLTFMCLLSSVTERRTPSIL